MNESLIANFFVSCAFSIRMKFRTSHWTYNLQALKLTRNMQWSCFKQRGYEKLYVLELLKKAHGNFYSTEKFPLLRIAQIFAAGKDMKLWILFGIPFPITFILLNAYQNIEFY